MISSKRLVSLVTTQVLLSVVFGCVVGILGLIAGVLIGGTFGFPYFYGLWGYEGAGVLGQILGIFTGISLGMTIGGALFTVRGSDLLSALCSIIIIIPFTVGGFLLNTSPDTMLPTIYATAAVAIIAQAALWHKDSLKRSAK